MKIKELNFPIIYREDDIAEYGGNQEWFPQGWQRKAGCGSTSGANLAAYYAANNPIMEKIYNGNTIRFDQSEFLQLMEEMYTFMRPGPMGFPYVEKFAKQFIKFCEKYNIAMEADILETFDKSEDAFQFVKGNIDKERPVALLILHHRAWELREDNWHWVTVTGYMEDDNRVDKSRIILSNCGERQTVDTNILFEVHSKNTIRMVSFRRKDKN